MTRQAERTTNRDILRFGEEVVRFFGESRRSQLASPLFNVPARMICGAYCFYDALPGVLRQLRERVEPEQVGSMMGGLGTRPNFVTLHALALGYLNGREQDRLRGGREPGRSPPRDRVADLEAVMGFWRRAGSSYLGTEALLPSESGGRVELLGADEVERLAAGVGSRSEADFASVRRTIAELELYTFVVNGEARTGVLHHGPYGLPGGDLLVVKELVGLRSLALPWDLEGELPFDAVVRVMRLRGVTAGVDLFGTLIADPFDYSERIVGDTLLGRRGERLVEIGPGEGADVAKLASRNQLAMYRQAIGWDDAYRTAYGADQYADHVNAFLELAGVDLEPAVRERFQPTLDRVLPGLLDGSDPPLVLDRIDRGENPVFLPELDQPATADA